MNPNVLVTVNGLDNTKEAFASVKQGLASVSEATSSFKSKLENLQPAFQKMAVAGTAALAGIAAGANKSVQAYAEVERAQRQLEHAVINVSKGTRGQVDEINKLTAALEKKAGVDADSLNMGVAQLSTFGLQTKNVVTLTKSLADLTVNQSGVNATSEDYIQSANTIAKALNGQFGVLERSGIRFTEAQQSMILYGTETEKVAALQEGFAQNLRETTDTVAGVDLASAKMSRTWENISENLGKALVPAFERLTEVLQPMIERFANWSESNPELLGNIVLIAGALAGIVAVLGTLGLILPPVIAGISLLGAAIGLVTLPILAVVAAIALVSGAIYLLWKNWDSIIGWMSEKFENFELGISIVMQSISDTFAAVWGGIKQVIWLAVDFIIGLYAKLFDFILPGWEGMLSSLITKAQELLAILSEFLGSVWEGVKFAFSDTLTFILERWTGTWTAVKEVFSSIWTSIGEIFDSVVSGITSSMELLTKPIQKVIDLAEKALSLAGGIAKGASSKISSSISDILSRGASITGKAVGGTVIRNTPYMVGEVGPELFVPGTSGQIVPNNALQPAIAGGSPIYLTITGNSFMGERDMAEKVGDMIIRKLKNNNRL
jgi:phage-related minor tail protein